MRIEKATSIPELFDQRVKLSPDKAAYRQYVDGTWKTKTWSEVAHEVGRWQAALKQEGLVAGDRVGVCMPNRTEWVLVDQAAMGLGLITVPLFYNDRVDNMAWCLNHAEVELLILEDGQIWTDLADQVKSIKKAIYIENKPAESGNRLISVDSWLPATADYTLNTTIKADDVASIVYTSGTTGRSKGVMLTHNNLTSDVFALSTACEQITHDDVFLSFLPLSHMFERTVGYYIAITVGALVIFARGIQELAEDMVSQQPTVMVCVPRIFERIYGKVQAGLPAGSLKRRLFENAVAIGWRRYRNKASFADNLFWPLLDLLVGKKLRGRMGGKVRFILLGGAPMPAHLFETFIGLGMTFLHGYGLTETSPVISFNRVKDNEPFSVGRPLDGVEVRLAEKNELAVRGAIIMKGYLNNTEATAEAIDSDGWFHTGDVAEIREGRIYITGRLKDIIVLTNGEKVPPGDIEQAILSDPDFEQVMLIGEGRPKLGLVVVSVIADEQQLRQRANALLHDFPGYARIDGVVRIGEAWTVENGLLTPTLKPKRNKIEARYKDQIDAMYANDD